MRYINLCIYMSEIKTSAFDGLLLKVELEVFGVVPTTR